ncbi:MAG: methyltransferase domain-containing protein [Armatimonadaceae bacterium]
MNNDPNPTDLPDPTCFADQPDLRSLQARYPLITRRLHLANRHWEITAVEDQDALLREVQTDTDLENFPYGLMLWASAIGLCEWLAANPSLVAGKRCLEIGAGIGLVGLVAQWLGAEVTQTDYQPDALRLCAENARANQVALHTIRAADWRDFPGDLLASPVVLASDILYERSLHPLLEGLLPRLLAPNGVLILSDPIRPQAMDFLERIEKTGVWNLTFHGHTVCWNGKKSDIAIALVRLANLSPPQPIG